MSNYNENSSKATKLAMLGFTGIVIVLFIVVQFGGDTVRGWFASTEIGALWFDTITIPALMMLCALVLLGCYIVMTANKYKEKGAFPPKFWSKWGIVKKVLGVIAVCLTIFLFVFNLVHIISDVNAEPVYKTYAVESVTSNDGVSATFSYKDPEDGNTIKNTACHILANSNFTFTSGTNKPTYEFRIFENTGMWIVVKKV